MNFTIAYKQTEFIFTRVLFIKRLLFSRTKTILSYLIKQVVQVQRPKVK